MLLRKWTGFRSLPSRYGGVDGGFRRTSVETGSSSLPGQGSENSSGNRVSFSPSLLAAGLEVGVENALLSKSPFPSQLKTSGVTEALELNSPQSSSGGTSTNLLHPGPLLRAMSVDHQPGIQANNDRIDAPRRPEYSLLSPSSTLRRRNSLSHLPNPRKEDFNSDQPLASSKRWSDSQPDLQANFLEETQRKGKLRESGYLLAGQPKEFGGRNLELEVDMMEFELGSLRQKMESSFVYLEKERKWLEAIRSEGRKRQGELDDKIFKVEMELAKTKSYFGKRDHPLLSQGFRQSEEVSQEKWDVGHELQNLQKSLAALKSCIKTLEEKRNEMVQQLKFVQEGEQSSASHPVATNLLEMKQERRQLRAAYKNIKLKNVALLQQVQDLGLELKHAQKKQEEFQDQISALKSELASSKNQAHQQEREKVLIKEEMKSVRQSNEELSSKAAESHQRLGALLEKLHLLEEEERSQANHIQALVDERTQWLEEKEQHLLERTAEQQCQEETRKALQATCENLRESQIQLQKEKDLLQAHCQDLERQAEELGKQLGEQESISQDWRNRWEEVGAALKTKEEELEKRIAQDQDHQAKMFPKEADLDLPVVQEELQKALEMLKIREMMHEEQRLELESARIQNAEWTLEKQKLQQLLRALEEQLAEKDQALRDLRQTNAVDRAALEMRTSSEPKRTREGPGTCYEKGRPVGLDAKTVGNQLEGFRLQHHLVTEQLKELFRQKQQQQAGARKHQDGGLKEKSSTASRNVPRGLTTAQVSLGLSSEEESHLESGDTSKREEVEQSLQQQLKAKTDVISAMACEIQALKEKNENLMQAKLRFQEQIQQIRQLSKRPPEKSQRELRIPRLSTSPRDDVQSAPCHETLEVSSQEDQTPSSSQRAEIQEPFQACPGDEPRGTSLNIRRVQTGSSLLPSEASHPPPSLFSDTSSASDKLLSAPVASPKGPLKHVEDEGASLSPRSSGLLSPKPFGAPRPWSPFRERAESPVNRKDL
ncbi:paramyosin-like isoform X2 [Crotalus tigris]|uniref:paramyosin-like isoform X2 n=1 Tax=Crotalus tigris TaxID=88082 RepID=UPI00192F7018|nr:paramyosin-like isoform X2 [Crotalus tigris]